VNSPKPVFYWTKKIGRIVLKTILILLGVLLILIVLIQIEPVQNWAKGKATNWLSKKLNTKVEIDRLFIKFPSYVMLEKVYIEDQQKDTLLYTGQLQVNINMWKLLSSEVSVNDIYLKQVTANVQRSLPDTIFNFQFIVDAFASKEPKAPTTDTSAMKISLNHIRLEDIRAKFVDAVSGSDMQVYFTQLETNIKTFDPAHNTYAMPLVQLKGLDARIYQRKPLLEPEPEGEDIADAQTPPEFHLDVRRVKLENCNLDYGNDVSALYAMLRLGNLNVDAEKIDLAKQRIELSKLQLLETNAALRLGKTEQAKVVSKETKQEAEAISKSNWVFAVQDLDLNNNHLKFDNDQSPRTNQGMDYMHLDVKNFILGGRDIYYNADSIAGTITKGSFTEKDFRLNKLQTSFAYTGKQAFLKDLLLETPGTRLERDMAIRYDSIGALSKDIGKMQLSLDVRESRVLVKDVLTFAPMLRTTPGFTTPNATWYLNGKMKGAVNNLRIDNLKIKGFSNTNVDLSGTLKGLPDIKKLAANLTIRNISSSDKDILSILPPNTLPDNIKLPANMRLAGTFNGTYANMLTDLRLQTSLGDASVKGMIRHPDDEYKLKYDVAVTTNSLDLQQLLKQPDLGKVTLHLTAAGSGRNPKTMVTMIKGTIDSAGYKGYVYRNFTIDGSMDNQQFKVLAGIQNEPIHFSLDADGSFAGEWPAGKFNLMIDSLKPAALHFTDRNIIYRGQLSGDFKSTNPDSLDGNLYITRSLLVDSATRFSIDTISLVAAVTDTGKVIALNSPLIDAKMYGRFKLTEAGNIFQKSIDPYFNIVPDSVKLDTNYDFRIAATIGNFNQWKILAPELKQLDTVKLDGHFSGNGEIQASFTAPGITYGANQVQGVVITADNKNNALQVRSKLDKFNLGTSLAIYNTNLDADIANNNIDFAINTRDKGDTTNYHIEGLFALLPNNSYQFSLKPDSLLLNKEKWNITADNKIIIDTNKIVAENFNLNQDGQSLQIATLKDQPGQPLDVNFSKFRIGTLLSFIKPDTAIADGELNGKVTLHNLTKDMTFVGDLTIHNASVNKDTLGDLKVLVSNPQQNNYEADITLTGRGNDVNLKGNYLINPGADATFKARLDLRTLQMGSIDGLTFGNLRNSSGTVTGGFDVSGTPSAPKIDGQLQFNKVRTMPAIMNSFVNIDQQNIKVNSNGIVFDNFTFTDSVNNKATLDGQVLTKDFTQYRFDLKFNADNFQALSTTKKDNKLYFGRLFFNSRLNITGTDLHPVVDGTLKVNEKTELTVILPQEDPAVQDRQGIVRFVDRSNMEKDTLFTTAGFDSLNTTAIRDFDVNVNVTVDKKATFNLIIDEANGDLLKVRGEANLNAAIDPSGKVTMTGTYELSEGSYDLSVNFLKRKFNIQEGSRITWQGDPTSATVDLTAVYIANTAPIDLVEKQLSSETDTKRNTYRQRLPFEVHLIMTGELLKPTLKFDIQLPDDKNYNVDKEIITASNTRLEQLRQEPSELNKQVFALLLLNHFIGDNPFSTGNSAMSAEGFARQSVSKLLSEQLNSLASGLIEGVDINFDLASSEDYTTGQKRNRTDLNVAVSKNLLNDRLTVSVGSNFALENPNANREATNLAENLQLDYKLSRDGRYALRAYRKNEYEGVLEGYIIETGVGIVITLDYNKFRQIFRSKKEKERLKAQREARRKANEAKEEKEREERLREAREKAAEEQQKNNQPGE
jgi:hypothetical protein